MMTPDDTPKASTPQQPEAAGTPFELHETILTPHPSADRTRPVGAAAAAWIGKSLGKYEITGVLGQGGMGVVLLARDRLIERDVAIKVLAGHLAADASARGRFLAE